MKTLDEPRGLLLEEAQFVAEKLIEEWLSEYCERIEIAGSIRRKRPYVKDIELVLIPKRVPVQPGLFDLGGDGPMQDLLHDRVQHMRRLGIVQPRLDSRDREAWGPKHKRLIYEDMAVDLFSVIPPAQWGVQFLIRTGPWEFSKRFVTPRWQGGMLPMGYRVQDARIVDGRGNTVPTPEEEDVFAFLGLPFTPPEWRQ